MRENIDERGRKLFIGGLHLKTTEDSLKAFYSQWGDLIDVVVMRDPQTGKSRGFGFVTYNDPASLDAAQSNRPHEVDGIKVDAKRAMPKEDTSAEFHATVNRLFVGKLKKSLTVEDLKQYFSEYGTVSDAVIISSPTGESRGFGFVTFDDPDSVDKIIVSRPHEIDGQSIEVKKALPKDGSKPNPKSNSSGNRGSSRGGFNNSFNPRYQDSAPKSLGNYPSANGNYRNAYNASNSAPYSQSYSAPSRPNNNAYESFNDGYSEQPAYNNQNPYRNQAQYTNPQQYNSQPMYNNPPAYDSQPMYNSQPQYSNQTPYTNKPMYDNAPSFASDPMYKNETPYAEPEYNYGQYSTPNAPPSRGYGFPPQRGGMDEYKKPAGGPMRGASSGFRRGGARRGSNPY